MGSKVTTTLVTFVKDVFPHVKGDVLNIEKEVLAKIDEAFYVLGDKGDEVTPKSDGTPVIETAQTIAEANAQKAADAKAAQDAADEAELADAQAKLDAQPAEASDGTDTAQDAADEASAPASDETTNN